MGEKHEKNVYFYDFTNYIENISVFVHISLTKQNHEVNIAILSSYKVIIKENWVRIAIYDGQTQKHFLLLQMYYLYLKYSCFCLYLCNQIKLLDHHKNIIILWYCYE